MTTIKVKGMSCQHCQASVTEALKGIEALSDVSVNLEKGEASFSSSGEVDMARITAAIRDIGFDVE